MISQGYSGGSGGPDRSFGARGFGGSCKSDWLGGSEEPSGSCEFYGSGLDGGPGGFDRYCGSSGSCWSCGSCGSGWFVMPSLCNSGYFLYI